jgi:hypothetical protein
LRKSANFTMRFFTGPDLANLTARDITAVNSQVFGTLSFSASGISFRNNPAVAANSAPFSYACDLSDVTKFRATCAANTNFSGSTSAYARILVAPEPAVFGALPHVPHVGMTEEFGRNARKRDLLFGGPGLISGTVKEKNLPANTPLQRQVLLFDEYTQVYIAGTWSDPVTGNYRFPYVALDKTYTVIAYDYTNTYRAVIANGQVPELMP